MRDRQLSLRWASVALLAEGVDRNIADDILYIIDEVALLAEGVDRNASYAVEYDWYIQSPSSRRAWIEIPPGCCCKAEGGVALLAEGVDRNAIGTATYGKVRCRPPRGGRG